ncbi:nucleotide exchange factor GrpE [Halobacteriales archaeon QH_10_67_22]|nr:MAG: nucleotide exchange factor GrpE [Halobacteriales archaeon QH_10_67_22]
MTEQDASDFEWVDEREEYDGDGVADALEEVVDADVEGETDLAEVDDALVERVAESGPEAAARELASLRVRVDGLERELDETEAENEDLTEKLKRKQAEFQNYKKRMDERREEEKQRATEDLVERLLDVRDNLVRALDQEAADAADIRDGIESTLRQFDHVLDDENVDVVEPDPGDEVDPHTHEVLMRVESDQPEDTIADVSRPGYVMAEKVIRPAQVTVSENGDESDGETDDE